MSSPLLKHLKQVWRNFPRMSDQQDAIERIAELEETLRKTLLREDKHRTRIAELEAEKYVIVSGDSLRKDNETLKADNERLRAAAHKALKEQDESDDHHSAACTNWSFLENCQHQCGLCDLREALREDDDE